MTLALACSLAWLALGYSELPSFLGSVLMLLRAEDMRSTGRGNWLAADQRPLAARFTLRIFPS